MKVSGRLIVVSNRLPITITSVDGETRLQKSGGGLVSALVPVLRQMGGCWVGWTGSDCDETITRRTTSIAENYCLEPVFLTAAERASYYNGFSNEIIWPLFHGLPSRCHFNSVYWDGYCQANDKFAEAVKRVAQRDDLIWVHDYHLMMQAAALRARGLSQRIAYFHHIPFPPADVFDVLPWRENILEGLLQFSLIGFQTSNDQNNFLDCLERRLPKARVSRIGRTVLARTETQSTKVGAYPISVDYEELAVDATATSVTQSVEILRNKLSNTRIVLGVDRLDYTKGIPERLIAYQTLLERNPELRGRVTMLQFVIPSREDIPEYRELRVRIETLISKINGRYSIPGWVPIQYFCRSISGEELIALYRAADVALVTPLRDGMNLVAKEFCAARIDSQGVLILSEFAGAAEELKCGAMVVNPYDTDAVAEVLRKALEMNEREQRIRMDAMRAQIRACDVFRWARAFDISDGLRFQAIFELNQRTRQAACS